MAFFSDYISVIKAEWLKLKNAGMFWLVFIMAAFIPALFTLFGLLIDEAEFGNVNTINPWQQLISFSFSGFGGFFFPVFLTLVIVRLTQLEHRNGGWKLIETQPISKPSLYLGKFSLGIIISFFCILALVFFSIAGGCLIMLIKENSSYNKFSIPFGFIAKLGFRTVIAGLGIMGIQYLFSVVISGFIGPFAIGLSATIAGSTLKGFEMAYWWPYGLPGSTVANADGGLAGRFLMHYELLSIAWMLIGLWLGYQWYERKTFARAYFKPAIRLMHLIIPAILFTALFLFVNTPVKLSAHNRTVIAGTIDAKEQITKVYLFSEPLFDTLLEIPVEKNQFHFQVSKNIPAGLYYLKAGNFSPDLLFFSNNDSLFISIKADSKSKQSIITGNRLAENHYLKNGMYFAGFDYDYIKNYGYELKPAAYARKILNFWKKELKHLAEFKTPDNIQPREDFIEQRKKLAALKYTNMLDLEYAKWFKIYHPNEKLEFPKSVDQIRSVVNYSDSTLLCYELYREKINQYYEQHYKLSLSNDTAYISKLCSVIAKGAVRDFLIYSKLKEAIGRTMDSTKREMLLENTIPLISKPSIHHQLKAQHALLKSLNRGKTAPGFLSLALNKDTISLSDLKGRYVVVDVWATWCGPCKIQSPAFERIADKYNNTDVVFVSLSVDHNNWSWQNDAVEKSLNVVQLLAINKDELIRSYGIEYIPRFMLFGPDGKIINAMMPQPTDQMFEEIIRQEIPGLKSL